MTGRDFIDRALPIRAEHVRALVEGYEVALSCAAGDNAVFVVPSFGAGSALQLRSLDSKSILRLIFATSPGRGMFTVSLQMTRNTIHFSIEPGPSLTGIFSENCSILFSPDARLLQGGVVQVSQCSMSGLIVDEIGLSGADVTCDLSFLPDGVFVKKAERCRFNTDAARANLLISEATSCSFGGVTVDLVPGGSIFDGTGQVKLGNIAHGTLIGRASDPLELLSLAGDLESMHEAFLFDFAIAEAGVTNIVAQSSIARAFDPSPRWLLQRTVGFSDLHGSQLTRELATTELIHSRVEAKARRPETIDLAGRAVLELRRRLRPKRSISRWILELYRAFGYGRVLRRPAAIWLGSVAVLMLSRAIWAICDKSGIINYHDGLHILSNRQAFFDLGDLILTAILLPTTLLRVSADQAEILRLSGGYLEAIRFLMTAEILFLAAAVRSVARVRTGK